MAKHTQKANKKRHKKCPLLPTCTCLVKNPGRFYNCCGWYCATCKCRITVGLEAALKDRRPS